METTILITCWIAEFIWQLRFFIGLGLGIALGLTLRRPARYYDLTTPNPNPSKKC